MSEIDAAAIRKIVRAMANKESVDRRIIADLLFKIGIIQRPTSLESKKMGLHPFEITLGGLFRGEFDCKLSSRLRDLFPSGLCHISDQLEALWRAECVPTQGNKMVKISASSQVKAKTKKTLVEECFVIDVEQLTQWGILLPHYPRFGFMLLFQTLTGTPLLCMWQINRSENSSRLGLTYLVPNSKKVSHRQLKFGALRCLIRIKTRSIG